MKGMDKLRENAEAILAKMELSKDLAGIKTDELIHELQVHQIELEMQNEELKRAQIAEVEIKERFIDLYDFAPVGYFTFSKEGLIKEVNLRGAELLLIPRTKLINRGFGYFVEPSDFNLWNDHLLLSLLLKDGEKHSCELGLKCEDGSTIFVRLESVRIGKMDGTLQVRTAMSDITERRQMEIALQESESRYRRLFEAAKDGILILDADTGNITDVNPFLINILGYSFEEFFGKKLWEIGLFKDIVASKDAFLDLQTRGYVRYEDLPLKTKDGRSIDFEFVSNVSLVDNKKVIQCNIRDITERKRIEEELKKYREHLEELVIERTRDIIFAKEEAEHANMAKTNFLQTMSHEIRTPLNAVLGFSEMLKLKTSGELNEKQEHYIDNIITGGNNLHNIIGQIPEVVKMYEGTLELHIEKIPVPETLDEIIGVIKEKAAKKNVLIEKNLDPELEYIEADKQKFKQVFINLLDNAVKFSKDEGGTVTINAKKEGNMARFSVSDRGIGIKEEDIEKIFQKFTQLDSGTSRKYGGTGIGLAISKTFVELHGGRIWVESKYGEGSTFTFTLPIEAKKR